MFPFNSIRSYDVRGKVALITGAGHGIGQAVATVLHERGASVALIDVDSASVQSAASALGGRAIGLTADVRDRPAMAAAVAQVVQRFGGLDVIVANAGVAPRGATLRSIDEAEFDRVIDINLTGTYNTVRAGLEHVIANRGHVVVVSSIGAFTPSAMGASYAISKAGVEQLGRALRIELAAVGASAGVAYFGVVDTAMVQNFADEEVGQAADKLMPWPLNRRITPRQAAVALADGIAQRAPHTMAPLVWEPYSLLRGAANVLIDHQMAANNTVHSLVRMLDGQVQPSNTTDKAITRLSLLTETTSKGTK